MANKILGVLGLGSIGLPIASNLLSAGFNLHLHTRSHQEKKAECLRGAKFFPTPQETAKDCDVFLICVTDDEAVEEVIFSSTGIYESLKRNSNVIDMSTISPAKARSISKRLLERGISYIDGPVTGGTEGAKAGTLSMFLGCTKEKLKEFQSVLEVIATNIFCFDEVGRGQEVKVLNQILVAGSYAALAEAVALGESLGLPMNLVIDSLQGGAASSWALTHRSEAMLKNKYPLGFKLALHYKDLSIAINSAKEVGLNLPITSKVREIEKLLIDAGYADKDVSVLRKAIEINF